MTAEGKLVFAGEHVRAVHYGETERICVKLDHGRRRRKTFPDQAPNKRLAEQGIGTLSIVLAQDSWFLTPENQDLRAALHDLCCVARDVRTVAFSMGGYGAVLLSKALHLRHALLFSPQYSIFPSRAPWDARRNRISRQFEEVWDDLDTEIAPDLQGAILFDPRLRSDVLHARSLGAVASGLRGVAVPFGGHPAHKRLVTAGSFWKIGAELFKQDDLAIWAHKFRREQREESLFYLKGMAAYLDTREARQKEGT
ncbi:hypothetical protein [Paracoccus aerodenitrificans]|uniref:hypothetical protein n=1 Tax=Paracoccus aerodenitrificans TaxID=3017781 RepID=UPI0022F085D5|nr:hypothetical protein [Paracoccus aerodenitrificans]WBU65424.1 hypothetical protein PAE61_08395 [Paracoccus aerodenitrificans]